MLPRSGAQKVGALEKPYVSPSRPCADVDFFWFRMFLMFLGLTGDRLTATGDSGICKYGNQFRTDGSKVGAVEYMHG